MPIVVLFVTGLLIAMLPLGAQTYHTPAEIHRMIATSRLVYSVTVLDTHHTVKADSYSTKIVQSGLYLRQDSTRKRRTLASYREDIGKNAESAVLYDSATTYFASGSMDKARAGYLALLEKYPANALLINHLGQTWRASGDSVRAKEYFLRAIEVNPHDFTAHRFLAELYAAANTREQAIDHITTAHLLNRNDTTILSSLEAIYARYGMTYDPWEFLPRYALVQKSGDEREIAIDSAAGAWLLYAFCQALWEFEPNYSITMMQNAAGSSFTIREFESMTVMTEFARTLYSGDDCPTFLTRLREALHNGDLEQFAVYEVFMRRNPETAMMMDPAYIDGLRDFIMNYHVRAR